VGWCSHWGLVERIVRARGREPVRYQYFEKVWDALESGSKLTIVRAPTGSGKTEAVATPFFYHLLFPPRPWLSLIYALPTRSLVFSMAHRLSAAAAACGAGPSTVTVNYGELLAPSPFLEGDIAVSTYDTLLYAFYGAHVPGYHVLLPMSKVAASLVVFDEVQLLQDVFWFGLSVLPYHVASLLKFGSDVVVMSATIPTVLREGIVEKARGLARVDAVEIESSERPQRGRLEVEVRGGRLEGDEAVELVREKVAGEGLSPALIVVNTVEKAASIFRRLVESRVGVRPLLLHSRLRRRARDSVERMFEGEGRGGLDGGRVVIVATQVVEAGLDLDVRLLVTELSPVDSLIQRLGRCARRTDGLAVVFSDPDGGRYIYPEPLLERTGTLLKEREQDLRLSVESVEVSQELVDDVYSREVVEELKRPVSKLIDDVVKLITHTVPLALLSAYPHEKARESPLLRLGVELRCLYLTGDLYQRLVEGSSVRLAVDEVAENTLTLSLRNREVPECIVHEVGSGRRIISLSLKCAKDGTVELVPRPLPADRLGKAAQNALILLNPAYYEFYGDREVGVVRLHGAGCG